MHVVVVGCGRVGSSLAYSLEQSGHTVAIIDRQQSAFRRLDPTFAGLRITGVGFDRDVLRSAGITEATALAAVTNGDNSNILIARVAKETFGVERVTARIYDPRRAAIYERLGIPTVATVAWTSERILRHTLSAASDAEWTDPTARFVIVERAVAARFIGRPVSEFEATTGSRLVLLGRLGVAQHAAQSSLLQDGDVLHILVAADSVSALADSTAPQLDGSNH